MVNNTKKLSVILLVTVICLPILLSINTVSANPGAPTINVHKGDSIQAAIDAANPGAKVIVHKGTYVIQSSIVINKEITLWGKDAVIQYTKPLQQSPGLGDYAAIFVTANNIEITGFTINLAYAPGTPTTVLTAIELGKFDSGATSTPTGTFIHDNVINSPDWGISGFGQKEFTITNNVISAEFPLWFTNPHSAVITNNVITAKQYVGGAPVPAIAYTNLVQQMAAIKLTGGVWSCSIANNKICSEAFGILLCQAPAASSSIPTNVQITANEIVSSHDGIYADKGTNFSVKNNIVNAANFGIHLVNMQGTAAVTGNTVNSGSTPIYVG